jgi:hypothetical protein
MEVSLWIPYALGIAFLLLAFLALAIAPESHSKPVTKCSYAATATDDNLSDTIAGPKANNKALTLLEIFRDRNMLMALPTFLVSTLRPTTLNVLLQYTSVGFGWKLSKTAVLISEVAGVNIVLFLLILPSVVSYVRVKYHAHPQVIDWTVARFSLLLLAIGALLLGLSANAIALIPCEHPNHDL